MKTRISLLFIVILFNAYKTLAQDEIQTVIAKFIISDASKNGYDITKYVLENEVYTVFYTSGNDGHTYMANVWPKSDSQSFGRLISVEHESFEETSENYAFDIFDFTWSYINSYDKKRGTAKVQVVKIYKPLGVAFTLKIVSENLDIIIYKGFMEGSIDFNMF